MTDPPVESNADLPPEVDMNGPSGSGGHAASDYDGVYAGGVPVGIAMAATRQIESGNDYRAHAAGSTASGAYQVIDSTWNRFGGYERAAAAPPAVQDQFAYESFLAILQQHGNDVSKIPLVWYYPAALSNPALMDVVPVPDAGNVLTPRQYQTLWMRTFYELLGVGGPPFLPAHDPSTPYVRSIAFPVLGPTSFGDDWGAPRGAHGERSHEGNDLIATAGQPLRAAVTGVVTRIRYTDEGTAGVVISITDSDGYRYNYFHINNDTPGTTDDNAVAGLRVQPSLSVGTQVRAGQVIGFIGDSGNAVGIPHLHFEIRDPLGVPMNPYPSLLAAQQREQCSVGIGPWAAQPADGAGAVSAGDEVARYDIAGPDGASWQIGSDGAVRATGLGAVISPPTGVECPAVPQGTYGTDARGVPLSMVPATWWDVQTSKRYNVPPAGARRPPNIAPQL